MASLDEVSRSIGSLEAQVTLLVHRTGDSDNKMDGLIRDVADAKSQLETISKTIKDELRPAAQKVQRWEQRGFGVFTAASLFAGVLGSEIIARVKGLFS